MHNIEKRDLIVRIEGGYVGLMKGQQLQNVLDFIWFDLSTASMFFCDVPLGDVPIEQQ